MTRVQEVIDCVYTEHGYLNGEVYAETKQERHQLERSATKKAYSGLLSMDRVTIDSYADALSKATERETAIQVISKLGIFLSANV